MTVRDRKAEEGASGVVEPSIAAGYPKALLDFAASRGARPAELLARAGLTAGDLAEPDSRVPLRRYDALMRAAIALCRDPAFALHFGEAVRMQDISIVGLICEAAETTAEVGRQLNRYSRLMINEDRGGSADVLRAARGKDGLWMEVVGGFYRDNPLLIEAELARLVCNARVTFGSNPAFQAMTFPRAAHFTYPEPSYRAEYERIFQAPLVFGSDKNALLLDEAFLLLKQPPTNRYVFGVLSERADGLLKDLEASTSTRARVESLLLPILHTGDAGMEKIAANMGLSRRTLLRRLTAEGATFEKVLDELRHKMALHYLSGRKVSVNETAYLVGFSEPAAFSRAFKRWTGATPGQMRPSKAGPA